MNEKFCALIIGLLLSVSITVIINNNIDVKAVIGGGGGNNEYIGFDYNFMWNVTENLSNVVHNPEVYPSGNIPMGRAFGSEGEHWTANFLEEIMNDDLGLENVQKLKLGPIKNIDYYFWEYTSKVETIDFNLTCNSPNWTFTNDGHIPKNETFAFPSAMGNKTFQMTYKNSFDNIILVPKDYSENWYKEGLNINNHFNISYNEIMY